MIWLALPAEDRPIGHFHSDLFLPSPGNIDDDLLPLPIMLDNQIAVKNVELLERLFQPFEQRDQAQQQDDPHNTDRDADCHIAPHHCQTHADS